ncbi:MAG TPA: glycoside hydrolase family 71/99-like protein [Gemmataceae bacterium]|jgi:hypothetical protein|nr:glycoside hydrolase family 71/99-like protein [Gemmataceae bacterium]
MFKLQLPSFIRYGLALLSVCAPLTTAYSAEPKPVDRPLILAHYMPWYAAKPVSKIWGWHWTMNGFDPERLKDSKRSIASHYYPLIGPYDSGDPVVVEYHLLLMKLSGIDGVIVDWYGRTDHLDFAALHRNTALLINTATKLGLKYTVCYEDQTIPKLVGARKLAPADRVKHARGEIEWLQKNWFAEPNYVRIDGKPLLLSFGSDGLTDKEWEEVFRGLPKPPVYASEHRRRSAASGAFDWPIPKEYPSSLDRFYKQLPHFRPTIPVAFPRFHDIYEEGKAQKSHGRIKDDDGRTWATTLERAIKSKAPLVQLATWNDWGEGTGIEPTEEFGYRDLEVVQKLRSELVEKGFGRKPADLRFPLRLYQLRQSQARRPELKPDLDVVAAHLAKESVTEAKVALERLEK